MTTDLSDADVKYHRKIKEEDDLDVSWAELRDILNGGKVVKRIKLKENPTITYGIDHVDEGGGQQGAGDDPIKYEIDRRTIMNLEKDWDLEFTKRGRKRKTTLEYAISETGSDENQEETIKAMLERQIATGEYKGKFKIDVREEDKRYNISIDKYSYTSSAYFVIIKDISSSMDEKKDLSYLLALYVDAGLREAYKDNITHIYILHNSAASEVSELEFFTAVEEGSTAFTPAYSVLESMLNGTSYNTTQNYMKKIDYKNEDVYVMHITDGEDTAPEASKEKLRGIFPKITNFSLVEIYSDATGIEPSNDEIGKFVNGYGSPNFKAIKVKNESGLDNIKTIVKTLFPKRKGAYARD